MPSEIKGRSRKKISRIQLIINSQEKDISVFIEN